MSLIYFRHGNLFRQIFVCSLTCSLRNVPLPLSCITERVFQNINLVIPAKLIIIYNFLQSIWTTMTPFEIRLQKCLLQARGTLKDVRTKQLTEAPNEMSNLFKTLRRRTNPRKVRWANYTSVRSLSDWVPRAGPDKPSAVQPVASRYTDWAFPAPPYTTPEDKTGIQGES
jgi:hypothetical protein